MCFGDLLMMSRLCNAYHKDFESHWRSILSISTQNDAGRCVAREDAPPAPVLDLPFISLRVFRAAAQITKPLEAANFVPIQNIHWPLCSVPAWFSFQGTKL